MFLNDQPYKGGRTELDFFKAICNAFEGEKPKACDDIPEPKTVNLVVLDDKRCEECKAITPAVLSQLKTIFPGLKTESVDYSTEEGKKLYESTGVTFLPALLFEKNVEEGEGYNNIQMYLEPTGDYQNLKMGANFDPTKEICDNKIDDTGNEKVDCDDDNCKEAMVCREEKPGHLQVFIMSDCPYGRKAIEALKEVVDNFDKEGEDVGYEVHYIASESGDGFDSLHGQYEVDENIIQLCVEKHSSDAWLDYLYCRSTKGVKGKDWKECAEETKVDADSVQTCFDGGEGKALLKEDIKLANALGVGGSPTWLANNKYQFGGIYADDIKGKFCKYNSGLKGCDAVLTTAAASSGPAPGACGS